jgi:hypothetical protein
VGILSCNSFHIVDCVGFFPTYNLCDNRVYVLEVIEIPHPSPHRVGEACP